MRFHLEILGPWQKGPSVRISYCKSRFVGYVNPSIYEVCSSHFGIEINCLWKTRGVELIINRNKDNLCMSFKNASEKTYRFVKLYYIYTLDFEFFSTAPILPPPPQSIDLKLLFT